MATQSYCTIAELKSIIGEPAFKRLLDDNEDRAVDNLEASYATDAIEQAATHMNMLLSMRYSLSVLATSVWCKWCNAYLALSVLERRRGNPVDSSIESIAEKYREWLEDIRHSRMNIPDKPPAFSAMPRVSNYTTELIRKQPVRVDVATSEGKTAEGIKRDVAWDFGWYI